MMSLTKWSDDDDYKKAIRAEMDKIDADLNEDEMSYPIPEKLTKEYAEKLYDD